MLSIKTLKWLENQSVRLDRMCNSFQILQCSLLDSLFMMWGFSRWWQGPGLWSGGTTAALAPPFFGHSSPPSTPIFYAIWQPPSFFYLPFFATVTPPLSSCGHFQPAIKKSIWRFSKKGPSSVNCGYKAESFLTHSKSSKSSDLFKYSNDSDTTCPNGDACGM